MKIIMPGGSGHTGQALREHFESRGDSVVVFTRNPKRRDEIAWDGKTLGPWASEIDGADVVINLAGRSVNCRYTPENLREMMDSRVDSTKAVGEAIERAKNPPSIWFNASTATIYRHRFDAPNDDITGEIGGNEPDVPRYWDYSIEIAQNWEKAFFEANAPNTRKVALRSAMTMSVVAGSVFTRFVELARKGILGRLGSGKQYVSWIHETDFMNAIDFLIERHDLSGPINLASPHPLPSNEFNQILREVLGVKLALPAAKWMLEIGAKFLKTDTELLLKSRRAIPTRLLQAGFQFQFPEWRAAATELVIRMAN